MLPFPDIPVLIMHAEDDAVVPHKLGKALHQTALADRNSSWPEVTPDGEVLLKL